MDAIVALLGHVTQKSLADVRQLHDAMVTRPLEEHKPEKRCLNNKSFYNIQYMSKLNPKEVHQVEDV